MLLIKLFYKFIDLIYNEEDLEKVDLLYQNILNYIYKKDKNQISNIINELIHICEIIIKDNSVLEIFKSGFNSNLIKYNK